MIRNKSLVVICYFVIIICALSACSKSKNLALSGSIEATQIDVNSEVNGKVLQVLKDEGSIVHKDDVIAIVDSSAAKIQVNNSEAALKVAYAHLDELKMGTRYEQIKQAEATVKTAKAKLDEIKSGSRTEQIKQAEAAMNSAKARLDEVKNGARSEQITQAEIVNKQAKEAYETAANNYEYRNNSLKRLKELYSSHAVSKQQLDDAQNTYDQAEQQLDSAKNQIDASEAQLNLTKNLATDESVRIAMGNYEQALAQYELLKSGSTTQTISAAEGVYEQALAQLNLLKNGATSQAISALEASVEQAKAILESAKLQVDRRNIKSPVDGVIQSKIVDVGQVVSVGTNVVSIIQNNYYWIKVYVPQELNAKVNLNQKVKVTTNALPNISIDGTVIFKSPKAEFTPKNIETTVAKEKDTVIAVKIRIDNNIDKLSAGMIANVNID